MLQVRKWASLRQQTLYRTVAGMMKNEKALTLLLRAQLPQLSESRMAALLSCKHRCVVAIQRYDVMSREELEDVEVLFHDFPTLQAKAYKSSIHR